MLERPRHFPCPGKRLSRRGFLGAASAAAWQSPLGANPSAPVSKVAVARCLDYDATLQPTLDRMFDQIGGLGRLVAGKTVGLKINLTGSPRQRMGRTPAELAQYTHPAVVGATMALMARAGARRIRILEGCFSCGDPLPEFMLDAGWDPAPFFSAAPRVEMHNTNLPGPWKTYRRYDTPGGGYIFRGFDLNAAYAECDVVVSVAKLKEHATCGITLAMKNMFGVTPVTIYGDHAGKDEPAKDAQGGRGPMHSGNRQPSLSAPSENDPSSPRDPFWRMPRIVVDVSMACPIHLSIIDGIYTMAGGEGPWNGPRVRPLHPGVLAVGLNPVCTDAVGAALMGFDPMAARGKAPFERCDSTLALAEAKGLGTRDLSRIEIIGPSLDDLKMDFRTARAN